ncbi:MAG: acyl carrier protein [Actinomycetota bacterium]|nr:acyl carrier protein [Actinomycetota bacterium]
MDQNIYASVERILIETFQVPADEVSPDATFESLELDSLDLVELTLAIEEELGVKIEDEEVERIRTVRDAVDLIAEKSGVSA